ncbi:interleukin-17D isoform X6 [Camelus ferus]|uniref:Interleukin-17D isoform X6 n=1 Tax=Camelus ferus TaxID=419612 RepID=A0A8B8UDG2_CAMFR|nr:interleukin-17D isoform X6 [Camelus ferus]
MPSSGHKSTSCVEGFSEPRHLGEEVVVKKRLFSRWPVLLPERFSRREALPTRARTCPTSLPSEAASFRSAPRRAAPFGRVRAAATTGGTSGRCWGRRSGCWWPASCWRCRRAGRGAPRGRAGGRRGRGAARTGRRSSWSSCTGGWRPACSAPSTTRCSWARASRRATPAARPGAGPPTAASGRPPTCAACLRGPTDAAASLQNLSLARISYDPARYPKYLPEAYCLCRGCLTGPFGEEDFRFRSTPVFVPAVVLRRTPACAGGRSVYTEEYVTVPVGCTCVPEQEKEADSVNSSMDKPGSKLLLSPSDKPGRP